MPPRQASFPGTPDSAVQAQNDARDVKRVSVLLPLPLAGAYDYVAPADIADALVPGAVVAVPLGSKERVGVIWDRPAENASDALPVAKLKSVIGVLPAMPISDVQRRFVDWVAAYTLTPPGAVLRMVLSVPDALEAATPVIAYRRVAHLSKEDWAGESDLRLTPARARVMKQLEDGPPRVLSELSRETGVGASVIHGLVAAGALEQVSLAQPSPFVSPDLSRPSPVFSPDQAAIAEDLSAKVRSHSYSATLLDGVTGSGKTEVYFEAIAAAVAEGRQALVLLPEIALSAQWFERFAKRFGAAPALWHSEVTPARRRATWRAVADGSAQVVVGARSALFLPFKDLGVIVVDEEHDGSFKQEEGVLYSARDMAVVRAHLGGIPVALVSATPSLETLVNARDGRYAHLHLPDRHGGAKLPDVELVDLRRNPPPRGQWLSPLLQARLTQTLAEGGQAMLFLNRRGYAPLTLCRTCGHRLQCPNCTAWMVDHRGRSRLECHHCGHVMKLPDHCPSCNAEKSWAACGPGVERLAEEAAILFPDARRAVMASDTLTTPHAAEELVRQVTEREIDLLIGTQVVAKGHHFPGLTLVGVVDADLGLAGGDLRAGERTFQLLTQVAGRAGRADRHGHVCLQTYAPEHPVMQALAAGARDDFLNAEAESREAAGMPPYGRLAALILSGPDAAAVDAHARRLARAAPDDPSLRVLGPAPAPLSLLRGRHRRRFLIQAPKKYALQGTLRRWLATVPAPAAVRVQVDMDPYSFF
ncbi:MAG TPA: primosomal protein N' [Alphaproteobacteria bacterium]|jgi:primosomal protein N' (replication factor Y)